MSGRCLCCSQENCGRILPPGCQCDCHERNQPKAKPALLTAAAACKIAEDVLRKNEEARLAAIPVERAKLVADAKAEYLRVIALECSKGQLGTSLMNFYTSDRSLLQDAEATALLVEEMRQLGYAVTVDGLDGLNVSWGAVPLLHATTDRRRGWRPQSAALFIFLARPAQAATLSVIREASGDCHVEDHLHGDTTRSRVHGLGAAYPAVHSRFAHRD